MPDDLHSTSEGPFLTVFTPTYNRAYTLHLVFNSLLQQSFKDFEWLIVDDGSVDNTSELVEQWITQADFPIRYIRKENGGKHTALNQGIRSAKGRWFLVFDSDDACVADAFALFHDAYKAIPASEEASFSTITARCMDENGQAVGPHYAAEVEDVSDAWQQLVMRSSAERWGINRTSYLQQHLFPEFPGEKFIPESIVWNRLSTKYKTRFINKPLRVFQPLPDGLTASMLRIRVASPNGTRLVYEEQARMGLPFMQKVKSLINYYRFSFHAGKITAGWNPLRWPLLLIGGVFYLKDRRELNSGHRN
ncbi:MAG: glycosyltransferase family 2 protein [Gammaproteobacteria bacterium]|nr:glycosyltransferase family 2 protein [Gammaproteobacteria bacterium]